MRNWLMLFWAFCAVFFSSGAQAQTPHTHCEEFSLESSYYCRLKPDEFSVWSYGTGVGNPSTSPSGAAVNTMAAYMGTPPPPGVCNVSYTLGPEVVNVLDGFTLSNQPIRTSRTMSVSWGQVDQTGCVGVYEKAFFTVWATGQRCARHQIPHQRI